MTILPGLEPAQFRDDARDARARRQQNRAVGVAGYRSPGQRVGADRPGGDIATETLAAYVCAEIVADVALAIRPRPPHDPVEGREGDGNRGPGGGRTPDKANEPSGLVWDLAVPQAGVSLRVAVDQIRMEVDDQARAVDGVSGQRLTVDDDMAAGVETVPNGPDHFGSSIQESSPRHAVLDGVAIALEVEPPATRPDPSVWLSAFVGPGEISGSRWPRGMPNVAKVSARGIPGWPCRVRARGIPGCCSQRPSRCSRGTALAPEVQLGDPAAGTRTVVGDHA